MCVMLSINFICGTASRLRLLVFSPMSLVIFSIFPTTIYTRSPCQEYPQGCRPERESGNNCTLNGRLQHLNSCTYSRNNSLQLSDMVSMFEKTVPIAAPATDLTIDVQHVENSDEHICMPSLKVQWKIPREEGSRRSLKGFVLNMTYSFNNKARHKTLIFHIRNNRILTDNTVFQSDCFLPVPGVVYNATLYSLPTDLKNFVFKSVQVPCQNYDAPANGTINWRPPMSPEQLNDGPLSIFFMPAPSNFNFSTYHWKLFFKGSISPPWMPPEREVAVTCPEQGRAIFHNIFIPGNYTIQLKACNSCIYNQWNISITNRSHGPIILPPRTTKLAFTSPRNETDWLIPSAVDCTTTSSSAPINSNAILQSLASAPTDRSQDTNLELILLSTMAFGVFLFSVLIVMYILKRRKTVQLDEIIAKQETWTTHGSPLVRERREGFLCENRETLIDRLNHNCPSTTHNNSITSEDRNFDSGISCSINSTKVSGQYEPSSRMHVIDELHQTKTKIADIFQPPEIDDSVSENSVSFSRNSSFSSSVFGRMAAELNADFDRSLRTKCSAIELDPFGRPNRQPGSKTAAFYEL